MANLVTGAMGSLIPKLGELLKEEYNLQTGMKKRIKSLTEELESAQAALRKVEMVPWDQLDEQVQIWARQVREASYDMEDVLDTFLVGVRGPDSTKQKSLLKRLGKKITSLLTKRNISVNTKDIMSHLEEVTERCGRFKVGDIAVAMPDTASAVDPRLHAMYNKVEELVGIDKSRGELISILQPPQQEGASNLKMKIVSIVGVGGLGKTTLAKAVFDELKGDFNCGAFVPVGRNPDLKKVLKDILMDLDKQRFSDLSKAILDERQLINELRLFLENKRYFIVIDDIWEIPSWEQIIKLAIGDDKNCGAGARILITTRKHEVAEKAEEVYQLQPLPDDSSRDLFFIRIGGHEGKMVDNKPDDVTVQFLKKCAGIPLAIITMTSLLADKPRERWHDLYRSIGFGSEDSDQARDTMRIVSFSYYDLPAHLRTCLLYLSAFPEDSYIDKDSLVWMWVAEGFVKKKQGMRLFETGEGYFHDLINRSMLEAVKSRDDDSIITGCRVHDMVLDFIRRKSNQENFFSIVLDNDQGPLLESNNVPRRLAHHNRTMGHGHRQGDDPKMAKVRSMFAIGCGIEALDPFHGFTLLRVLVIDNRSATEGSFVFRNEHIRHLRHLRFLSIQGARGVGIPEEIGRLRFLLVLDLQESYLKECPSLGSLPEQLECLRLPMTTLHSNDVIFSLTRLTSLEELSICVSVQQVSWGLPTELRVLELRISGGIEATTERDFWECVRHLNKLEHLTILVKHLTILCHSSELVVTDFVLPGGLRHFAAAIGIRFCKLPSCVNASCLPNLSHLDLCLERPDEHDLKMLGRLPELRFLCLGLHTSATGSSVVVVSEKDAAVVYFPKLRCCELRDAMVSFQANEEDKSISFHLWNAGHARYIGKPSVSEDKLQSSIISCSTGGGSTSAAGATGGGAPRHRFMPCLQVFRFVFHASRPYPFIAPGPGYGLGFEYGLPSLREIRAFIPDVPKIDDMVFAPGDPPSLREVRPSRYTTLLLALRSAAEAHPNRPAFRAGPRW